jgi:hypothetical protein
VAVGAGGMAQAAPVGTGPSTNLGKAFDKLVLNIEKLDSRETLDITPNFPRFLYKTMAHIGWNTEGKKNGLRRKELKIRRDLQ